jgi:uncharacterized protein
MILARLRRRRRALVIGALVLLALWLASSAYVAWDFTRRSGPYEEPTPKAAWGKVEGIRLVTSDNQKIGGWLVRADHSKGSVLLLHGIGASRHDMLTVMQWLAEAHYTSLAITLRAHGDSTGETNDFGWSSRHDVVAAVHLLRAEFPGQPVFIVGRSMGAAAAIFAAKDLDGEVAGYFLEQPYKDLQSAVWNRLHHHLPPVLDWTAYAGLRLWAPVFLPVAVGQISPYDRITDIPADVPIVLAGGSADRHAPLDEVRLLLQRVESHARIVVFDGATHEALDRNNPRLYRSSLFGLLESHGPRSETGPVGR